MNLELTKSTNQSFAGDAEASALLVPTFQFMWAERFTNTFCETGDSG